jgi:hypothetical protein
MLTKLSEPMSAARIRELVLLALTGFPPKTEAEVRFMRLAKHLAYHLATELGVPKGHYSITASGSLGIVVLRMSDKCYIALGRYGNKAGTDAEQTIRDYFCFSKCDMVERTAVHWASLLCDYDGVVARLKKFIGD